MKTTIVLANRVSESEKLKSLASFGETVFDVRYMASLDLAEYLLQLSGVAYPQTFIKNDLLSASLYVKIKEIDYFKQFTYNDILGLIETLQDVRYHIIADEAKTIHDQLGSVKAFKKKNEAILQVYDLLQDFLQTSGYIDEAGVVRFALENTRSFPDVEFIRYEKSHLRPLEKALLDKAAGKAVGETKICADDKPLVIKSYLKAFGQSNEIEDILSYIYKNGIHFDDCLIACSSLPNYANILANYRDLLGFPVTLGVGRPVTLTNPGRLFSAMRDWRDAHYHGEFLLKLASCPSFDLENFKKDVQFPEDLTDLNKTLSPKHPMSFEKVLGTAGDLKVCFDAKKNNARLSAYESLLDRYASEKPNDGDTRLRIASLPFVKNIIEILNQGEQPFLDAYAVIRDGKADANALGKIDKLLAFERLGVAREDIEKQIAGQTVSREAPQAGTLYFTAISHASSCLRKHLFLVGLSSDAFPGKNVENPIFLDQDYAAFGVKEASTRDIRQNKEDYYALLEEAKKRDVEVHLSWACYNEETLKAQNSSSVIFETYQWENGKDKTITDFESEFKKEDQSKFRYIEYFHHALLPIDPVGKAVAENKEIKFTPVDSVSNDNPVPVKAWQERALSASAVEDYAKCEYLFFLKQVLGLESPKEIDVSEIIPANDFGILAHDLLSKLDKNKTKKDAFLEEAKRRFDEYLIFHPTETPTLADLAKNDFLETMENAYEMEGVSKAVSIEKDISVLHKESGLKIHGIPDKVIENDQGGYYVIDYKTSRQAKHNVDTPADMVQCTLYSYLFSHYDQGGRVDGFEYRYIRLKQSTFSGDNGKDMPTHYENLKNILLRLKDSLNNGTFNGTDDKDACKKCYYKDYCNKKG